MRFYTQQRDFYCGIDLHARSMYLCVLDRDGRIVLHHNMASAPEPFLEAIAPYRGNLVVGVECIFCWYWLADLLRRRMRLMRKRAQLLAHVQNTNSQYNLPEIGKRTTYKAIAAGWSSASPIRPCGTASRWISH